MIKSIKIEQFVIIDKLELDFQQGLTILTGDTGAGKSILLGAMGLILGEKSTPKSIRQGHEQSVFEAVFEPIAGHPVLKFLEEKKLSESGSTSFSVYRVMKQDGSDEIKVNGKPIDRELLEEIGHFLIEIHGQFANQTLLSPENQLHLLDLSGDFPKEIFGNVSKALHDVRKYEVELDEEHTFQSQHKKKAREIDTLYKQFEEISMEEGFESAIKERYATLLTAKETSEAFQAILARLISANGVVGSLSIANQTMEKQNNLDEEKVADLKDYLSASLKNARDAVAEMGRLTPEYEIDTAPLKRCRQIIDIMNKISTEHKIPFENLYEFYSEIADKRQRIINRRQRMSDIQSALQQSKSDYLKHAHILTEKRLVAAEALSKSITAEFSPLKLERAELQVQVIENPNATWTELGLNEVTFVARMNPGTPFSPIAETASGGELARMILGLKVVLQKVQTTPTLVFDEVDTGIGGAAAAAVGERIAQLSGMTQVLVITHSPQVASRGDQHLHVSKKVEGETTTSAVRTLTVDERIEEISRMLAGDVVTEESFAAAKRLLSEAGSAASQRQTA